jgi:hypothetical protein
MRPYYILLCVAPLTLSACATARMHSEAELDSVGQRCGLALGELIQDDEEKRLLFLFRTAPTAAERACVHRWARKNNLRAVFIEAADGPGS